MNGLQHHGDLCRARIGQAVQAFALAIGIVGGFYPKVSACVHQRLIQPNDQLRNPIVLDFDNYSPCIRCLDRDWTACEMPLMKQDSGTYIPYEAKIVVTVSASNMIAPTILFDWETAVWAWGTLLKNVLQ